MATAPLTERCLKMNFETTYNLVQSENLYCLKEIRSLAKKKLIKGLHKQKIKEMYPFQIGQHPKICRKHRVSIPTAVALPSAIVPIDPQEYSYPLATNEWHPMHSTLFSVPPIAVIVPKPPILATHICPYTGTIVQPFVSPIVPQTFVQDVTDISKYTSNYCLPTNQVGVTENPNEHTYVTQEVNTILGDTYTFSNEKNTVIDYQGSPKDSLEQYLTLPKELFPTARMLTLDPNPIINEFCKMPDLMKHIPWLLDLEFGIPKCPITRPIPTYDVKFNSIHCKNAPDAIHPGFESCDEDFKKVLLFYYDCIVSAWYKGYIILKSDSSVENFQSWLLIPMQVLGLCWP